MDLNQPNGTGKKVVSRRRFVQNLALGAGAVTAASILSACGDAATPNAAAGASTTSSGSTTAQTSAAAGTTTTKAAVAGTPAVINGPVTLTLMVNSGDFSKDDAKKFTDANPNITLNIIEDDATRFKAMLAAGTPPDLFRTYGPVVPSLVNRKIALDLTDFFKNSSVLKVDDLAPSANLYVYQNGRYGMPKDWSPDFTLWANNTAFQEAGIPIPSTTKPMTYAELATLAAKLTKREGDRTTRVGLVSDLFFPRHVQRLLGEQDQLLYKPDFSAIVLKDNPLTVEILKYFFDLAKSNYTWNPLNPDPGSYGGEDFLKGQAALVQYGYWYSGSVASSTDLSPTKVTFLPSPNWSDKKRLTPTVSATGYAISRTTKNPDAIWKFFEFYMGGPPAVDRAKSGWGVPSLKSLYPLMPTDSPFRQQVQTILQEELKTADAKIEYNPYYDDSVFENSWKTNLEQALRGSITFDKMLSNIESEVNTTISETRSKLGK
jgi:multiple sugar transport system substrate-binding protein